MSQELLAPLLWLIPAAPLLSAVITALLGPKLLKYRSHIPCWSALAVSFAASLALLVLLPQQNSGAASGLIPPPDLVASPESESDAAATDIPSSVSALAAATAADKPEVVVYIGEWLSLEPAPEKAIVDAADTIPEKNRQRAGMRVPLELRVDSIASIMLAMVTGVSLLVALFGSGYMHHDPGYPRFFAAVSMFVFSMCMLVMSNSFVMLFVFWEMVGLCSYLLIGFWFRKPSAAAASKKAFVVNRIGDFGLIMAIFLIWTNFGTVDFAGVLGNPDRIQAIAATNSGVITLICFCLFLGAMGKSAQFPLQVWLPDAMEGPTPVSALIHAATMVTAGVYLVARCTPLFVLAPQAQLLVTGTGAITAAIAALIALTQTDLKRVLAYSTVSQLGFMFMALGCGAADPGLATMAVTAGMFHLFTHAFFKALLFLAAGSVMHAMGDVIDMRRFSGLRRALPITHWTFLVGAAALAGVPLLAGFWSKDEILAVLMAASRTGEHRLFFGSVLVVASLTALLTAFYTFRAYFMTFWGPEKFPEEAGHHPHEATPIMAWPLRILAVAALLIGLAVGPTHLFSNTLARTTGLTPFEAHFHLDVMALSVFIASAGIGMAWMLYVVMPKVPGKMAVVLKPFYVISQGKFYLDEILYVLVVLPLRGIAFLSTLFDRLVIDGLIDSLGTVPRVLGDRIRSLQGGVVTAYAGLMWVGLVVLVVICLGIS
ncbi:MAG TPA: NADH-quinone oxidoreductase subunit L [Planctomycetaceae bacterium]|nr:NADH-quinone oxidoreductase subunit L [Planctomycetaceae bacterium]HBC60976.1 NADH-quinone oxidoreductase subunit L [Planctomycetaceae bacterium]